MTDLLGVLAHPGGLLVDRPELIVGVVQAMSTTAGLEIELIARQPVDRRKAADRQAAIRSGDDVRTPGSRRLLPAYDEGLDLRFGHLTDPDRVLWSYPERSSSDSGGPPESGRGPGLRALFRLPPIFDAASFVLAWPEIGFPETVVRLDLPDRATVERQTVSIWEAAPRPSVLAEADRPDRPPVEQPDSCDLETGRTVAQPCVLVRGPEAVVVLDRLTAVGPVLSMEIRSVARRDLAGPAVVGVARDDTLPLQPHEATTSSGAGRFEDISEYLLFRPGDGPVTIRVGWPAGGIPARVVGL